MQRELIRHPDAIIYVRTVIQEYAAHENDFAFDLATAGITIAVPFPTPSFRYRTSTGMEVIDGEGRHTVADGKTNANGEEIIDAVNTLVTAQNARENPPLSLAAYKAAKTIEAGQAGFERVERDYPAHAQRRLALIDVTDADRIACRDLIVTVKVEVDRIANLIATETSKTAIDIAFASLNLPA